MISIFDLGTHLRTGQSLGHLADEGPEEICPAGAEDHCD